MANGKQKRVSELIGSDYKRWKDEFIVLDCGTGCGKSYFCLHVLGKYAKTENKRILYLCNRNKLRNQVYNEVRELRLLNIIYVTSYQAMQKELQAGKEIPHYDYIVADECHYFTTDAIFNDYTDVSYNYIMKQKKSVVLFVSATAKTFFKYLSDCNKVKKRNVYRLDKDYSYVNKLYYYEKNELVSIINDILENEPDSKIVVFCNNGDRIIEMNKVFKDEAHYYCSKNTKERRLKEICGWKDNKQIDYIKRYSEKLITFDKRILFTTSVLDNGVDLKDYKIKHIFTEIIDVDTMIQSLGRKRSLNPDDTCTFYIRRYQKKGIQGFINKAKWELEPVKLYKENYAEFYSKYVAKQERDRIQKNDIFYSSFKNYKNAGQVKVNECKYRKYTQNYNTFTAMKGIGHVEFLGYVLDAELIEKAEVIEVNAELFDVFMEFLKSIEGKKLFKDDREYIRDELETIGVKLRYTGINTFNGVLDDIYKDLYACRFYNKDCEGNYYVETQRNKDGNKNPNRNKKYWILERRQADKIKT